jgi:ribosome biogenesis protein Nip4
MKPIEAFASKLGAKIGLNTEFLVEMDNRYYLLNPRLKKLVCGDFFYSGLYLGKVKNRVFFPSFNLLAALAENEANKVVVDKKAAWLFICGRDIFRNRITTVQGSRRKGDYTLILNDYGECLGFGRITRDLDAKESVAAVKNVSDVGDFLRREG